MAHVRWEAGWYEKIEHQVDNFMEDLAKDVHRVMKITVPVKTGFLKSDLDWEYNKRTKTARVGAQTAPYAIYVEEGTSPHPIEPNETSGKKMLWWEGAAHPVYHVNHPGATATHFMKEALYSERRP